MSPETLIHFLVYAIVVAAVAAVADWGWRRGGLPRPDVARVVIWVVALLLILARLV